MFDTENQSLCPGIKVLWLTGTFTAQTRFMNGMRQNLTTLYVKPSKSLPSCYIDAAHETRKDKYKSDCAQSFLYRATETSCSGPWDVFRFLILLKDSGEP